VLHQSLHQHNEALVWASKAIDVCVGLDNGTATTVRAGAKLIESRHEARRLVLAVMQLVKIHLFLSNSAGTAMLPQMIPWLTLARDIIQTHSLSLHQLTDVLLLRGEIHYLMEQFEDCVSVIQEALRGFGDDANCLDPSRGRCLYALSRVLVKMKREDECEDLYRQSVNVLRATRGENHSSVADVLHSLGRLLHSKG
jgi:tetratricopeptide (TPR) repeat protein